MWRTVLELASTLNARVSPSERQRQVIFAIHRAIPCDSVTLLKLEGGALVPLQFIGLVPEVASQRFVVAEHPRLAKFVRERRPIRIADPNLPDPFDGLMDGDLPLGRVHACMGCALVADEQTIGVLALDALDPHAFDEVDEDQLAAIAALAAAAIRTGDLIANLQRDAEQAGRVARDLVEHSGQINELLGQCQAIERLRGEIALAARSDLAVLVTGETGVGKEVVVRSIYTESARAPRPLIYVNCAALPDTIAESELFGHVRGAFTGAVDHRAGKFEVADGGTLFLDEVGELPLAIQPKLLRALQSGEIQRVGSDRALRVDVRIIAATNRDLAAEVTAGRFRADLYHRLSVFPIHLPPLRERGDDANVLAGYFLDAARLRLGLGRIRMTGDARAAIATYDWPGNVRELEHTLIRAALRASEGRRRELVVIEAEHLGLPAAAARSTIQVPADVARVTVGPPDGGLHGAVERAKREIIERAVEETGSWAAAARWLNVDRGNLHRMARRLGIATPRNACAEGPEA